jgi:hypothetical protein
MQDIKSTEETMDMRIRRCGANRIAQYGMSRARATFRCHWTPTLGQYSPCTTPADAPVIDFGVKNQVVAL